MSNSKLLTIENRSTVVSDAEFAAAVAAIQHQISYHFKPYWNEGAILRAGVKLGSWHLAVVDDSDQAGALGYHTTDPDSTPDGLVFARTSEQSGYAWSGVLSHEVLELIADPWATAAWQTGDATFHALEVCDPVEVVGYEIDGVEVSNFVLPKWFILGATARRFDHLGRLKEPLDVEPGGYVLIFESGGWNQYVHRDGRLRVEEPDAPLYVFRGGRRVDARRGLLAAG